MALTCAILIFHCVAINNINRLASLLNYKRSKNIHNENKSNGTEKHKEKGSLILSQNDNVSRVPKRMDSVTLSCAFYFTYFLS